MKELLILLIIGVTLSIDAFSVSTVIGMTKPNIKKIWYTSIVVGVYHFFMPLIGIFISYQLEKNININSNLVLGIVLLLIAMQMFIEYINPSKKDIKLTNVGTLLFGLGVSLDSLTIGIGLNAITNKIILSSTVFSICSFSFTFIGLSLGKYISKALKNNSYLIGTILLFILGIVYLCKII